MPVPVPPPEAPAIVQPIVSEEVNDRDSDLPLAARATPENPVNVTHQGLPNSAICPQQCAKPAKPENFAPEYSSPLPHSEKAESLGEPISRQSPLKIAPEYQIDSSVSIRVFEPEKTPESATQKKASAILKESASRQSEETEKPPNGELLPVSHSSNPSQETEPENRTIEPIAQRGIKKNSRASQPLDAPSTMRRGNPKPIPISSLTRNNGATEENRNARFLTQERGGASQTFEMNIPATDATGQELPIPEPIPPLRVEPSDVIELTSDEQEYDQKREVVTAQGNAVMRFDKGVLSADRVQINLRNRIVVADGEVALKRGDQILRGDRFEYFFVQDRGSILNASGEIYQPNIARDTAPSIANDGTLVTRPLSDRLLANQPLRDVSANPGVQITVGGTTGNVQGSPFPSGGSQGEVTRQRFEAARVDFDGDTWRGTDVRLTNDPFSPPELEVRADSAEFRSIGPEAEELVLYNPRLVFDQGLALPLFPRRFVFDRSDRDPGLFAIKFDDDERGGVFLERNFEIYRDENIRFQLTPQFFVQRTIQDGFSPNIAGGKGALDIRFSDRTFLSARAELTSLDLGDFENHLRANVRLNQTLDIWTYPHTLTLEANFRDRLFNGSLGFQTVQSSFGAILTSPVIALGDTGINLAYQGSIQSITADTDRVDLLPAVRQNNRINLTRYQGGVFLSKNFPLWQGEALPATPNEGLRYTPVPVVPYLQLTTALNGVTSYYSSGDSQPTLSASLGVQGQFGHFSRPFFDYTGFNVTYTQGLRGDTSPFLFDRFVDTRTLSFGITQQIYGPFRLGFQSTINLDTSQEISTDYIVEYSRRTHNILFRYNPVLGLAAVSLRISDFNWNGSPEPFRGSGVRFVEQGVTR
ncbi:DUF3769 domain-containing protein [Lusitaniella coriacea LEGE 07157]|uniref:DUF3769 domain-containing protein n=1 Tax=Lusitaniella coriacea LEGE 07157 TaxID=945747 RepID=A0A8J7DVG2_9CYAN|nr:DUF3769 domain-containing protein [Lusitaniella coriacea]MBE9115752.1 DUF3769 domain-containing protein [Lusitaniella coriacea LEGE 07157]